jgi:hypothetical protein
VRAATVGDFHKALNSGALFLCFHLRKIRGWQYIRASPGLIVTGENTRRTAKP